MSDSKFEDLIEAIAQGDMAELRALLRKYPKLRESALSYAVERGKHEAINVMLAAGVKADLGMKAASAGGRAALLSVLLAAGGRPRADHVEAAATSGDLESVQLLLGARVELEGQAAALAIRAGARHGRLELIELLLRHAKLEPAQALRAALLGVAGSGDLALFEHLFERWQALASAPDPTLLRDVFGAAIDARTKGLGVARWALEHGASANEPVVPGRFAAVRRFPPLIRAVDLAVPELVAMCLEHGADPNTQFYLTWFSEDGGTALVNAAENGEEAIVDLLLRQPGIAVDLPPGVHGHMTPLMCAARCGRVAIVEKLLRAGADVNHTLDLAYGGASVEPLFGTAYSMAKAKGQHAVCELLIAHGAHTDPPAVSLAATAQLAAASKAGDLAAVEQAVAHGAALDAHWDGVSPLCQAAQAGHVHVVKRLFALGAKLHDRDVPILSAIYTGNRDILDLFIAHSAGRRGNPISLNSALREAAEAGDLDVVERLLALPEVPIDLPPRAVDQEYNDKQSPLMRAACEGHLAVVRRLIEAGADVNLAVCKRLSNDKTPSVTALGLATAARHFNVVDHLRKSGAYLPTESKEDVEAKPTSATKPGSTRRADLPARIDYASAVAKWAKRHSIAQKRGAPSAGPCESLPDALSAALPRAAIFAHEQEWRVPVQPMFERAFVAYTRLARDFKPSWVEIEWDPDEGEVRISFRRKRVLHEIDFEHNGRQRIWSSFAEAMNDFAEDELSGRWLVCPAGAFENVLYVPAKAAPELAKLIDAWVAQPERDE